MAGMMRVCLDMEFTGLHQNTTPISIGLVTEDALTFYGVFNDYDGTQVNDWIQENILANTEPSWKPALRVNGNRKAVAAALRAWLESLGPVEVWIDVGAYDWVLFCELLGGGTNCLPDNVYYIPFDLATLLKIGGIDPDVSRAELSGMKIKGHNALDDAMMLRSIVKTLMSYMPHSLPSMRQG